MNRHERIKSAMQHYLSVRNKDRIPEDDAAEIGLPIGLSIGELEKHLLTVPHTQKSQIAASLNHLAETWASLQEPTAALSFA